jgi:hypothetical protein
MLDELTIHPYDDGNGPLSSLTLKGPETGQTAATYPYAAASPDGLEAGPPP